MSLLESNRNNHENVKPKKSANIDDLNNNNDFSNKSDIKEPKKTTLTIDTSIRNKLQAMVIMGDSDTMKEGVVLAIKAYYDQLSEDRKMAFESMYRSLEKRDK